MSAPHSQLIVKTNREDVSVTNAVLVSTEVSSQSPRAADQVRSFVGLLRRDASVQRRELPQFIVRTIIQPLLITFVFGYLLPRIGQGVRPGLGSASFGTVLVPGLVAISVLTAGIASAALPLSLEFASKEMEDPLLAPLPTWGVGIEKMLVGALQGLMSGVIVFPIAYFLPFTTMSVHVDNWALLGVVILFGCALSGAMGLTLGCLVRPNHVGMLYGIILTPMLFLGCVYYPWGALYTVPWVQVGVLVNPLVYLSEGLRAALTPGVPHLPVWAFLAGLVFWVGLLSFTGIRLFKRRALG
jgi:ABC-2 type transport system permease protein